MIHIEVQGDADPEFPKRMFPYFYRIYDRYDREIVAMAIQTGTDKRVIPNAFEYSYFGTDLCYVYDQYTLMEQNVSELEQSPNLFSKAVLAAIYSNKTKHDADARFVFKVKLLHDENIQRPSISALFYFIDYLLRLPEELKESLRVELQEEDFKMLHFEKNNVPPTVAELMAIDRAEGIKEGIAEERKNIALALIPKGFDDAGIANLTKLSVTEVEELRKSLQRMKRFRINL